MKESQSIRSKSKRTFCPDDRCLRVSETNRPLPVKTFYQNDCLKKEGRETYTVR